MKRVAVRSVTAVLSLLLATGAFAASSTETAVFESRGERIQLNGRDVARAGAALAGRGIEGVDGQPVVDHAGRELVWKRVRREVDDRGYVHAFYRQYLVGDGVSAEVFGSEVNVHYMPEGTLLSLDGSQFRSVIVANGVAVDRQGAIDAAAYRMLSRNLRVRKLEELSLDGRMRSLDATKLMLVQRDGVFRYTYFTFASDAQDQSYRSAVDADTEEIAGFTSAEKRGFCTPSGSLYQTSATGVPVRPELADAGVRRSVKAHDEQDIQFPDPYEFEGYWHSVPYKTVYQQYNGPTWMCNPTISRSWTIFPLRLENGVPVYKDWADDPQWKGSIAGDAIYHTDLTMRFLKLFGRNSWDNANGPAKVIIQATNLPADQAKFNSALDNPTVDAPTNSLMIGVPQRLYSAAASLDWVAHEWGHGVIDTSASFPYVVGQAGAQLHEGFADVIAHMVENYYHPVASGLESADYKMHEDASWVGYARGVVDDNAGHAWSGPGGSMPTQNNILHALDTPTTGASDHSYGNKLAVVYKMLADGGGNPVCARLQTLPSCSPFVSVQPQGRTKANRILFDALQYHIESTDTFDTLVHDVADAAFAIYNRCSSGPTLNAAVEQQAVFDAFRAIGHHNTAQPDPIRTCP